MYFVAPCPACGCTMTQCEKIAPGRYAIECSAIPCRCRGPWRSTKKKARDAWDKMPREKEACPKT